MASKKSLVVNSDGSVQQLQAVDTLTVGDWDLPNAISDNGKVIITVGGAAAWDYSNHTELVGVTADQHHPKSHLHNGADGSGDVYHGVLAGIGTDNHHPKSHNHAGDGSGTVEHDSTGNGTIVNHDTLATGSNLDTLTDGSNADALHVHAGGAAPSGDTTYYLATSGSDSTGIGTVGNPWKTVEKALTVLYETEFELHAIATIVLEAGTYLYRDTFVPEIATNLVITGPTPLEYTISAINAVVDNAPLFDAQLTVNTTTGMIAGQYLAVLAPSGKKYLNGGWEIISVDDGTHVTIRIYSWSTSVIPGVGAWGTIKLPLAIIETQDEYGFRVSGRGAQFKNVTFYPLDANATVAIEARDASLQIGPDVIVNGYNSWGVELWNTDAELNDFFASRCLFGVNARTASYCEINRGALGGNTIGAGARFSHIHAEDCSMNGNSSYGLRATEFSLVAGVNCDFYSNSVAIYIRGNSKGYASGTFANNGTDYSPAGGTEGNQNSYMAW